MNYIRLRQAILKLLLESKEKNGQGMLTADTLLERLGKGVIDDEVQYALRKLRDFGLVTLLPDDGRKMAAALTSRGEVVARGDTA